MIFPDLGSALYSVSRTGLHLIVRATTTTGARFTGIESRWSYLPAYPSRVGMDTAQCVSDGLVENFCLSFFGDKGLESGYDFVAAGHDAIHLRFGQIAFGFFR